MPLLISCNWILEKTSGYEIGSCRTCQPKNNEFIAQKEIIYISHISIYFMLSWGPWSTV